MAEGSSKLALYATAAVLSLITLTVFFVLQDYGPESTVRRFHQATVSRDDTELRRVTAQDLDYPSVSYLRQSVYNAVVRNRASVRLGNVAREPGRAVAEVDYLSPFGSATILWVVVETKAGWKIDADQTLSLLSNLSGR